MTSATTAVLPIDLPDIRVAHKRIGDWVLRTPVIACPRLRETLGVDLFFKCENLQHVGAFKARGACNAVFALTDAEAKAGVVTHSSGNHAAALARAARLRGIPAHIVMPHNSRANKMAAVRQFGIEPILCEPDAGSRQAMADRIQSETGATMIHPYNDLRVMAGQGTVGLELLEQVDRPDVVIIPVGGGGLLSGCLVAIKSLAPQVEVIAAEPAHADDAYRSLQRGQIEMPIRYDTIADGLRTPLGSNTFPIIQALLDEILLVDEDAITQATRHLLTEAKLVVEPSGAVPLAVLQHYRDRFAGKRVVVVLSGGNLDFSSFPLSLSAA